MKKWPKYLLIITLFVAWMVFMFWLDGVYIRWRGD
jgi:hypothetical protein